MLKQLTRPLWQLLLNISKREKKFELNCSDCFFVLEYLAELRAGSDLDVEKFSSLLKSHMVSCPDCQDYYSQQLAQLDTIDENYSDW